MAYGGLSFHSLRNTFVKFIGVRKIQHPFSFFIYLILLECNTVLWGTSISEVNKWGFDLVIFFCNTEVIPGKHVVICNALYVFFCNSGQFSFFSCVVKWKTLHIFPKLTIFVVFCGHTMISNGNVRMFCLNWADEFL